MSFDKNRKVSIVLAGAGGYGAYYVEELLLRHDQGVDLVAIADPIAEKSPIWDMISHIPRYDDLKVCLEQVSADAVIISSPIQFHEQQISVALAHGAQVLCEKPLCATFSQGEHVARLSEQKNLHVGVGFQWSFSPVFQTAKKDVLQGVYGVPRKFTTIVSWPRSMAYYTRNSWAGRLKDQQGLPVYDSVIHNATAHYLHHMLFFLGQSLDEAAMPDQIEGRLWRGQPIENYDTAFVKMKKKVDGHEPVELLMIASHLTKEEKPVRIEMTFSAGRIYIQDGQLLGERFDPTGKVAQTTDYGLILDGKDIVRKTDALIQAARSGDKPVCHARTALPHLYVIDWLQKNCPIRQIPAQQLRTRNEDGVIWHYMEGLDQQIEKLAADFLLPADLAAEDQHEQQI